jgi:hypothetical protein
MVSLYFQKSLLELDTDEVNQFLLSVVKEKTASSAYFRDTVCGLRFFFRLCGLEDLVLRLLSLRNDGKAAQSPILSTTITIDRLKNRGCSSLVE